MSLSIALIDLCESEVGSKLTWPIKKKIATYSSYYLCSITQNQTFHSSLILDMTIKSLQHNLHEKDIKNMY
jgi:hypothetical protein